MVRESRLQVDSQILSFSKWLDGTFSHLFRNHWKRMRVFFSRNIINLDVYNVNFEI